MNKLLRYSDELFLSSAETVFKYCSQVWEAQGR